ncbi:MAG: DMT family transporter [Clostridiales bacterium]|jgi:drug/metabolite transporter (DMT)-like permease|nr:DMT family transporter [Clostridiales bacterium]
MREDGSQARGAILIMLASVAWSFSGVLSKWAPWGPFSLVGARALIAALVLGASRGSFRPRFSRGTWLGAIGVTATSTLFIVANRLTTAANAIVLQYAMPIVVIFACWILWGQRPGKVDIIATVLTLGGVLLCFIGGFGRGSLLGDSLALMTAFTFALVFFAARLKGVDPMDYTYLGNLLSALFVFAIPFDRAFIINPRAMISVLAMGASLSAGYWFFTAGMRTRVHPVTASIVAMVEPVLNPLWAFLFLGEDPGAYSLLGAALVILSVSFYSILKARQARLALE